MDEKTFRATLRAVRTWLREEGINLRLESDEINDRDGRIRAKALRCAAKILGKRCERATLRGVVRDELGE